MNTPNVPSREAVETMAKTLHPDDPAGVMLLDLLAEVERLTKELKGWTDCHPQWVIIQHERDTLRATVTEQAAALAERDKDAVLLKRARDMIAAFRYSDLIGEIDAALASQPSISSGAKEQEEKGR